MSAFIAPLPLRSTPSHPRLRISPAHHHVTPPIMRVYTRPRPPPAPKPPPEHQSPTTISAGQILRKAYVRKGDEVEVGRWLRKRDCEWDVVVREDGGKVESRIIDIGDCGEEMMRRAVKVGGRASRRGKRGLGTFAVRGGLRYMYQPPPPYCSVGGSNVGMEHCVRDLDGRVWYLGVVGRNKVVSALEIVMACQGVSKTVVERNVMIAGIVADLQMDCETVCAAVLKGCLGGIKGVDEELVGRQVGWDVVAILKMNEKVEEVVEMVRGREEDGFDALRDLMVAVADDPRAISLQLASAVVAMRSLGKLESEERKYLLAQKALMLYGPLAHQLGIWFIQSELEELAFMYLHPEEYNHIRKLVGTRLKESRDRLQEYKERLERAICGSPAVVNNARSIRVKGRVKGIYSTYRKMKRSQKQIDEIYDLLALRVLVQPRGADDEDEHQVCYDIFEAVKLQFNMIDGRYKDYISFPKPNGYKSLHGTICPGRGLPPIEIQIRTEKMHHVAEFGAAAHWIYQEETRRWGYGKLGVGGSHQDDEDIDGNGGNGTASQIMEELVELKIPSEEELRARVGRIGRDEELEIVRSRRKGYLRCMNALIRGSWVIVNSAGKLYKMAVGSTLRDLAVGMGLASFNAIAMVNGSVAPLTQRLEMNDIVRFISELP